MRKRKLFTFIIAVLMAAILAGCDDSGAELKVVGTMPPGYVETFTSLEGYD